MAIDNIIAAGIQPATPIMSPMQTMGGLMQLRGQMADQSLREAQMAEVRQRQQNEKLRGDQANRDLTDQNTIQALGPEDHAKLYAGDMSVLRGKVQPTTLQKIQATADEHVTKLATGNKLNLENRALALTQLKDTAVNLGAPMADGKEPDAATINSRYESARAGFAPLLKLAGIESPLPASITTPEELRNIQVQLHAAEAAVIAALARKKATADAEKAKADASMATKKDAGTDAQGLTPKDRSEIDQHNAAIANAKAQLPKIEADAVIARLEKDFMAAHGGLKPSEVESRRHNMADELRAAADAGGDKLLTVAEAATLGVPYGTTREQAKGKSPTKESQQVTANYASRIKQSNDQLNGIEDQFADQWALTNWAADKMWNSLKSNDRQAMDQSKRNFINAVLRRESGAVITDPEFANANQQYFVQPGDGKKVIEQKRQNRNLVQRNFIKASGNAYEDPPAANAAHKVGDTVQIGDKRIKISEIHADGTFDGNEVK